MLYIAGLNFRLISEKRPSRDAGEQGVCNQKKEPEDEKEMSTGDHRHLKCLKEEEEFLLRMQLHLQKQLRCLKVEEAALLKMISSAAKADWPRRGVSIYQVGDRPSSGTAKDEFSTLTSQKQRGAYMSGENPDISNDVAVNQAPLSLKDLTVAGDDCSDNLPLLDVNSLRSRDRCQNMNSMGLSIGENLEEEDE